VFASSNANRRLRGLALTCGGLLLALSVTAKASETAKDNLNALRPLATGRSHVPWPTQSFARPPSKSSAGNEAPDDGPKIGSERNRGPNLLPGGNCKIRDPEDPRFAIVKALATLRPGGISILECAPSDATPFAPIVATLAGQSFALVHDVLSELASTEGFAVDLEPIGKNLFRLEARVASGLARSIHWRHVDDISVTGSFLRGDRPAGLLALIGLRDRMFNPEEAATRLASLGYSASFVPRSVGAVLVEVEPKPILRWVKAHGLTPLSERELISQMSLDARPGALSRGSCVKPSQLRKKNRPPICAAHDISCRQWEEEEVRRIETFLFDRGYLQGRATLGLACGRDPGQATLHVFVQKNDAYRLRQSKIEIQIDHDKLGPSARRTIARSFVPHAFFVFPTAMTRAFVNARKESTRKKLARPNSGDLNPIRPGIYPFPEASVGTNLDTLTRDTVAPADQFKLQVRISLGPQLQTHFFPAKRGDPALRFTSSQLAGQLKLFERQESPSPVVAEQESANLRAFYQSKGYLLAEISGSYASMGALHQMRFAVAEGPHVRIRAIELVRPNAVPVLLHEKILKGWHEERELNRFGRMSDATAVAELSRLSALYQKEGYACARAYLRLAFWPKGFDEDGANVRIGAADLLRGSGHAAWTEGFNAAGIAALRRADRARLYVRLEVDPGPRFETSAKQAVRYLENPFSAARQTKVPARDTGSWSAQRIFRATDLYAGLDDPVAGLAVHSGLARNVVDQVIERYRDNGYPLADAELGWSYLDVNGEEKILNDIRQVADDATLCAEVANRRSVSVTPVLSVYEGQRGVFGKILIRGNFKTRTRTLRSELKFSSGQDYRQSKVTESREQIESLGIANRVDFSAYPIGCSSESKEQCQIFHVLRIDEGRDYLSEVRYGFGAATLNPLYAFVRPAFPNLFGTAWNLELEGSWGVDTAKFVSLKEICAGVSCYERRARTSLSRAHLPGTKIGLEFGGQYQLRTTPARGEVQTLSGNVRTSFKPAQDWNATFGYRFQRANISKDLVKPTASPSSSSTNATVINRPRQIVRDDTGLLEGGLALTRVDNAYNPERGYLASAEAAIASPWLGGSGWWTKVDFMWQHFVGIPRTRERLSVRYSLRYGQIFPLRQLGTALAPEVWRYYGGGSADLGLRGILPETMLLDIERIEIPFGGAILRPRAQGGHIRAIGTFALQYVSIRDFFLGGRLAHSIFYDSGVLTHKWQTTDLRTAYRHSIGVNVIKWNINVATLSFGYAVLLGPNHSLIDDRNGRPFFEVGITF
jgi:outer membrane protein assembly factor BamA